VTRPPSRRGLYVAIEGIDGAGKSTLLASLGRALRRRGYAVRLRHEPVDRTIGRLAQEVGARDPWTGAIYFTVDRHLASPGLQADLRRFDVVLSDRSFYSTLAYQGSRLSPRDRTRLGQLQRSATVSPDRVILLELPASWLVRRLAGRSRVRGPLERARSLARVSLTYRRLARGGRPSPPWRAGASVAARPRSPGTAAVAPCAGEDAKGLPRPETDRMSRSPTILLREETLDPSFVPPKLPHRDPELALLTKRYREALAKGLPFHLLLTGGIGSGKTALVRRLAADLGRAGRLGEWPVHPTYVNCWRRASDRTVMLDLLRSVGVSLPDRGYSLSEMLDVFEQGIRRTPAHHVVLLDEASSLVKQGTKLVYLLSRGREVGLGSISLVLIATEDLLPYLDAASRSSFGVTHRVALAPYDRAALTDILASRAEIALRPGSYDRDVLEQIARIAAPNGDARFALEVLTNAARAAEDEGQSALNAEHVRRAKGSIVPTVAEGQLDALSTNQLGVLLALSRTLKGKGSSVPSQKLRSGHSALLEELGGPRMSRTTFWRTLKELERDGLVTLETGTSGESSQVAMDELPASLLATLLEERLGRSRGAKT
jgi:archaeal cell division control protein 6